VAHEPEGALVDWVPSRHALTHWGASAAWARGSSSGGHKGWAPIREGMGFRCSLREMAGLGRDRLVSGGQEGEMCRVKWRNGATLAARVRGRTVAIKGGREHTIVVLVVIAVGFW
jgi:hypothetical protein